MTILLATLHASWGVLLESAPFLLLGFLAAGLLHGFISQEFVADHLGKGRVMPVLKAAALGLPLPLCSCGVLPAAMGLRQKGATKGATVSFLVSTPETGIDSIALTYALLGPVMALIRPLAAIISAIGAGLVETAFEKPKTVSRFPMADASAGTAGHAGIALKIRHGVNYAFGELLRDLVPWLAVGVLIAGLISAIVPSNWITENIGSGWGGRVAMLIAGIPMYICATASTPVAAALMMKGLSPGAALILLLAGPATNAASLVAMRPMLGTATILRYLATIAAVTLLLGWLVDLLYVNLALPSLSGTFVMGAEKVGWLEYISVALLLALSLRAFTGRQECGGCC